MSNIEKYYKWICDNPNKANDKIKKKYKRLVEDIKKPREVSFLVDGKPETHIYRFNEEKAKRPIEFIEKYIKQSKGQWNGKPLKLELFQKARISLFTVHPLC